MHLRLAADLVLRSSLALGVSVGVAQVLVDEGVFLHAEASPRVASAEFGVWTGCNDFLATEHVPLAVGQSFGWHIDVPDGRPVVWHEELVLPEAPASWSGAHFVEISDDGRVATTAGVDVPWEGSIEHAWSITEGDPAGEYELRLWIDGRLHERFFFQVE
ncbi:MAG: hypothetical protein FJ137_01045 [Deltaproteobacteria bacterium]|nr:hypothetical protein [Deltaproteobacteria bacterium]